MLASPSDTASKIQSYWNTRNCALDCSKRLYWYHHPQALAHYRRLVSRLRAPLSRKPINCYLAENYPSRRFRRGLSIGCGAADKERALVAADVVQDFDLFELSDATIDAGRQAASRAGIADRLQFHHENIFERPAPPSAHYDLVHWDNALHHMFSVEDALAYSVAALKPGGLVVIDDYVGPTYMQVCERIYAITDQVRAALPEKYLRNNTSDRDRFPLIPRTPRIPVQRFLDTDPSEMADSGNILAAVRQLMPGAKIIPTGGILFFLGLRPLFGNFDETDPTDHALLEELLQWDYAWTLQNPDDTFHAFVCWQKLA